MQLRICPRFLAGAIALFGIVSASSAATSAINPSADTFVSANAPNNNYGGAGAIEVSASGLAQGEYEGVMQFDLSGTKSSFDTTFGSGQWQISSVTLQLTATSPNNGIFNTPNAAGQFAVTWMQNDSWTEGTGTPASPTTTGLTDSTLPSFLNASTDQSLGSFSFAGGTSGNATYTFGLPSAFVSDILNGGSVSLHITPADSSVSYLFNSRSGASHPLLTVTAVTAPEPSMLALLGGIALVSSRRSLKK